MNENAVSRCVIEAAVEVQRELGGPGLLESIYEEALAEELRLRGLSVQRQVSVPLWYKGRALGTTLRLDLLVNDCVVVECKAVSRVHPVFVNQALTYLRLSGHQLALLINFAQRPLRPGIQRIVNGLLE